MDLDILPEISRIEQIETVSAQSEMRRFLIETPNVHLLNGKSNRSYAGN